jgi:hypothetical protein
MSLKTLTKVAKSIIMIEENIHVKKKCIATYHQESNSDESNDFDEEDQ